MIARILSRRTCGALMLSATATFCSNAVAQSGAGYFTDPSTGIVYQKVTKTVERPVVETQTETRNQTIYRAQTVTETKPETRTIYRPVVEYKWEPRVHGRWNPFQRPTVAYHHVPNTRWQASNEVFERTKTRTEWLPEKRTIEVPKRVVRMTREQMVDYEPVGRVAPQNQGGPPATSSEIASRLRPLGTGTRIEPLGTFASPRIAASTVNRMTSVPPSRTAGQGGLRPTELAPSGPPVGVQALPPATTGVGIADLPSIPFFR